jgi:hypothetical protein
MNMCLVLWGNKIHMQGLHWIPGFMLAAVQYNCSAANLQETKDRQQDQWPEERNQRWADLFRKKDGGGGKESNLL